MASKTAQAGESSSEPVPSFGGNRVCLDFINSLDDRKGEPKEHLYAYTDLVAWGVSAELLTKPEANILRRNASAHQSEAERVFEQAIMLREALYRIFYAVAKNADLPPAELSALHHGYVNALPYAQLRPTELGFDWVWPADALEAPLWRLMHDAVELLRTGQHARFKECANDASCGWLFYDTSKNNSRRWCSMASCGTAEKVQQQRQKRQASRG